MAVKSDWDKDRMIETREHHMLFNHGKLRPIFSEALQENSSWRDLRFRTKTPGSATAVSFSRFIAQTSHGGARAVPCSDGCEE